MQMTIPKEHPMTLELIAEARIRKLSVYYYLVMILWPAYLLFLPPVFVHLGGWVILYMIFPGLYIFTWTGYLMHESWHKFVPNVNNSFFYHLFALMILSDPQVYHIIHGSHHAQVNSYADAEFHPLGEIKPRGLRILCHWLEAVFGVAFLVGVASLTVPRDPRFAKKYRAWKLPVAALSWAVFLGGLGFLSHLIFGVAASKVLLSYALSFWLGSFFLHQSQLVEHGNLIVEGDFRQRNARTRNLKPSGIPEKAFLFLTHNDSREHVLHHTMTTVHSRPFPGVIPLPENAVSITMGEYFMILWRMLTGEVKKETA
jgi:fatty acid desaturase